MASRRIFLSLTCDENRSNMAIELHRGEEVETFPVPVLDRHAVINKLRQVGHRLVEISDEDGVDEIRYLHSSGLDFADEYFGFEIDCHYYIWNGVAEVAEIAE